MIGPVSPYSSGFDFAAYAASRARTAAPQQTEAAATAPQAASPQTPVQPVRAVGKTTADTPSASQSLGLPIREGVDPAEMAVRMRIQYVGDDAQANNAQKLPGAKEEAETGMKLPGEKTEGEDGIKSAQEVMEEGECQTCAERKYQDGSDDPGVSFKTAAHIAPEQSAATVRGHEMEHVVRNQAKAAREGKEIVSQSVTISNAICPECGKVYTSGGTTRTVYSGAQQQAPQQVQPAQGSFSAVA